MANLTLKNIEKIYSGEESVVSNFNLSVRDEEFIIFVGPSGCGKSTVLRMIAGLEDITSGELYIDGNMMNDIEPKDRDIAMVFQNYALYPHMTVYDNMAFGLKLRKVPKGEIRKKVLEVAEILGIEDFLDRKPKELSGGQRQRVALGRAIVRRPKVFLMDEPLSNLDAKLRVQMRSEIVRLHKRLKTTFIYVTHDQTEAMTMGDKIVVIDNGVIQQYASPEELYNNPNNMFVAGFIGSPQMNFLQGKLEQDGTINISDEFEFKAEQKDFERMKSAGYINRDIVVGVRPEDIYISESKDKSDIMGIVNTIENMGSEKNVFIKLDKRQIVSRISREKKVAIDESVYMSLDLTRLHFFDSESETRI